MLKTSSINIKEKITGISEMKFLLILGVVFVHCDVSNEFSIEAYDMNFGIRLCHYISSIFCSICVPCFFIISGFLFFRNIDKFDFGVYEKKIKSRFFTLFIPYIIWCSICCLLLYVKHKFLHMPGLNIFLDNGSIDWINLLKGYWSISESEYRPYAFAFWFIRNLMVFVILSPVAWIIGKSKILTLLFFTFYIIFDIGFYGFEWFLLGSFSGIHKIEIPKIKRGGLIVCVLLFLVMCLIRIEYKVNWNLILFIQVVSGLLLTAYFGNFLKIYEQTSKLLKVAVASTFMIYATHQCYCTKVREFYCNLFWDNNIIDPIISYILSFMTLTIVGVICYVLLKKVSPRLTRILTGGR